MKIDLFSSNSLGLFFLLVAVGFLLFGFILGIFTRKRVLLKLKEAEFNKVIERERKAKEAAEEAIRARDEFLSIVSHELKTPLTTITLRLQSTLDSILNQSLANFSGEKLANSLIVAHEQTGRLQRLIKDLLNFSLITKGELEVELKEGDLNEIVRMTLSRFQDHLELAGCSLELKTDKQINGLWDQVRLEQAISNLLTNAIKYGEAQPIKVEVVRNKKLARIIVTDDGIGIDPAQQKIIFERFQRGVQDKKYQGLVIFQSWLCLIHSEPMNGLYHTNP